MTAQIIKVDFKRKRRAEEPAEVVGEMVRLGEAWTALTLRSLATAARIATTPLWPWP